MHNQNTFVPVYTLSLLIPLVVAGCASRPPSPPCRVTAKFQGFTSRDYKRRWLSGAKPKQCKDSETNEPTGLKQFRNYIRISSIGPFAHHFTVFYLDEEASACEVDVIEQDDKPPIVNLGGCMWGGIGCPRPTKLSSLPPSIAKLAQVALSAICDESPDATDFEFTYEGSGRQINLAEEVVYGTSPPHGVQGSLVLVANDDLTEITEVIGGSSGLGPLCGYRCIREAIPVSYIPTEAYVGRSLFYPLLSRDEPLPDYWPGLREEILKTARAIRDDECGRSLEQYVAAQGDSLLPDKIDPELRVEWMVVPRPYPKKPVARSKILAVPLRARDAVFALAKGESQIETGGMVLHASAELSADIEIDPKAIERKYEFPMTLKTRVWDERGTSFERTFKMKGSAALDRGKVAFYYGVYPLDTKSDEWKEMRQYQFPAHGDFARVDLYLEYIEQAR